ncbi:hypothetical protein [Paraflavitalea speifideaquila]|uniref:hypothetical protein n=1 Tax=Paraflavitalea speifideaquila TaxID=3076558 RepID=UPI0028E5B2E2|nr:hypothetical protein [Paraflavitalea speifideiaquila]
MKFFLQKYTRLLPVVLCAAALQSCDKDFEEINTNPNAVSTPTPQFIFSKALYDGALNCGNTSKLLLGTMQYTTSFNDVEGFGSKYVASQVNLTNVIFTNSYPNQINEIGEVIKAVKTILPGSICFQ